MNLFLRKKAHIAFILSVIAIIVVAFAVSLSKNPLENFEILSPKSITVASSTDPFANISVEAKAIYVLDLSNGKILFSKNADEVLPLASLTKLVSVIVASKYLPAGTNVSIAIGDSNGLDPGETWSFEKLVDFTLVTSSNVGINSIASVAGAMIGTTTGSDSQNVFVDEMNNTMATLGFPDMRFLNPSGLDENSTISGGYGSAKDVAGILYYLIKNHPDLISATGEETTTLSSDYVSHIATNTDEALPLIPNLIASKTGYTDLAGGNLAVIMDAGLMHPVALVVLGSSYDGRFSDMEKLSKATIETLSNKSF